MPFAWCAAAGAIAGLALGYLGAGGTVVGMPFILYLAALPPHRALGTNALGVSMIAATLLGVRLWRGEVAWRPGALFLVPGLAGIWAGARAGLLYPGEKLVALLGIVLFAVAAWMLYLSTLPLPAETSPRPPARVRPAGLVLAALAVGATAGFFAIGGGFMIVPALAVTAGLDLLDAAAVALLPIAGFSGWVGMQYWRAAATDPGFAAAMLPLGLAGGLTGMWLGRRVPRHVSQRVFAVLLVAIGVYMGLR
jgi:uncharacterized membrane protein YfcA